MRFLERGLLLAALIVIPRAALGDDEDSVSEDVCRLGQGQRPGKIVITTEKETCGSGGCSQTQSTGVVDGGGKLLLGWTGELGDFGGQSPFSVECKGGAVVVSDDKGALLKLGYDPGARQLRLPASVRKQVEAGWRAPPASGAAAAGRERLGEAFDALMPPGSPQNPPPFEILGLEPELAQSHWLLVARDKLAAGAWESAETIVTRAVPGSPPPTAVVARRRTIVTTQLAAGRRQSVPIVIAERHRVGTTPTPPRLPISSDEAPTLFWRGDALCVVQEDQKPPTAMRCLDPATRKWGAREPLQKPRSSGEGLRWMTFPNVTRCEGIYVVQKTVPETDRTPCGDGPGEDDEELVAVVDGDAMLLASDRGLRVNRGPGKTEALTAQKATALLASSAGTWLAGNGCCRFLSDGRLVRFGKDGAEHIWPILGPPPEDQQWYGAPLVSPAQSWAVAFSKGTATAVTLWLLRLANQPPRP